MIHPYSTSELANEVAHSISEQKDELDSLRSMVRALRKDTYRIKPRSTTSISIVGADGGNNKIQFDPFLLQVVRVVDSNEQDHCLEIVSPNTDIDKLVTRHFENNKGITPLGRMMDLLGGIRSLRNLSSMIPSAPKEPKPSWVQVYRELQEWAVLLDLVQQDYATDTLVMRDGWLRSKVFSPGLFREYRRILDMRIANHFEAKRRRIYVAGVLKRSKVLQKFRLAMMLEGVLRNAFPCYVRVPTSLQKAVFEWTEIIGGVVDEQHRTDAENMVAGEMFFVKFGNQTHDQVWVVDLLSSQVGQASTTFGYMLADAITGFPMPFFPMSLQRAHENAAIEGWDVEILQHCVSDAVRTELGTDASLVDEIELAESELTGR